MIESWVRFIPGRCVTYSWTGLTVFNPSLPQGSRAGTWPVPKAGNLVSGDGKPLYNYNSQTKKYFFNLWYVEA